MGTYGKKKAANHYRMGPTGTGKEAMGAIDNKIPMEWYSQDMFKSMNSLCANFDYKKKNVKTKNTRLYGQTPVLPFFWFGPVCGTIGGPILQS